MPTQSAGISLIDLGLEQFGRFRSPKTIANAILICHSKDIKFLRFTNKIRTWSKYYIIAKNNMLETFSNSNKSR
jgi:hypothetical protein